MIIWQITLITLTIKDSLWNFTSIHLYIENKINSKEKNVENLDDICCLGKENISKFNIDIVNKLNSLNKHMNYFIFGKKKYRKK